MSNEVQPDEPVSELVAVIEQVTAPWLRREMERAARREGVDPSEWDDLDAIVSDAAAEIVDRLRVLLATDVDEQRSNPLAIYRASLDAPTEYLRQRGVPERAPDSFAAAHFPDDPYRLGPATWSDVAPDLETPGLMWGAWKAMTVLARRRDEGLR
jgi:hypothetical protein